MSDEQHYYAVSTKFSGVFHFTDYDEMDQWINDNNGERIESRQVDPDIREQFGDNS